MALIVLREKPHRLVCVIRLKTRKDVLDKAAYILSNPVAAGLVAKGKNWPGVWLFRRSHSKVVKRPAIFFRPDGKMPEKLRLNLVPPPQFADPGDVYERDLEHLLERREAKVQAKMELSGRSFLFWSRINRSEVLEEGLGGVRSCGRGHADRFWAVAMACQKEKVAGRVRVAEIGVRVI